MVITHPPGSSLAFLGQVLLFAEFLKVNDVLQVRDEPDGVTATVEAPGPHHSDVAHRIACGQHRAPDKMCNFN